MSSLLPLLLVLARRFLPAAVGCLAIGVGWHATLALANPTPPIVASGSASFPASGTTLTVTTTPGTIINWQSFNIGQGATTQFVQQSAAASVLNRTLGQDPAMILGTLSSNGRVPLINANVKSLSPPVRFDTAGPRPPQMSSPSYVAVPSPQSAGSSNNVLQIGRAHV